MSLEIRLRDSGARGDLWYVVDTRTGQALQAYGHGFYNSHEAVKALEEAEAHGGGE